MLPEFFHYTLPTKMLYSDGLVSRLSEELDDFEGKALIMTDKIIVKNGMVETLKKGLKNSKIEVALIYDAIPPDSELAVVMDAAQKGKEAGCNIVIAIGGGSVLDTAKVTNLIMKKGGSVKDHFGAQLVKEKLYPSIFIPTTSGTGSEITQYAMISDKENNIKIPFSEDRFLPDLAVLDPQMTMTMPGKITAATGMDALTHAIESYVSVQSNPISEALSLKAVELIGANIRQACANPEDVNARGSMLLGSFLAAMAFSSAGVGMVHAIAHALGGIYHIPHGLANSIILPFSIEHNMESSSARYAKISEVLGDFSFYPVAELSKQAARFDVDFINEALSQFSFVDDWLVSQSAKSLAEKIRILNRQLASLTGHATSLKQAGVKDNLARIEEVVDKTLQDGANLYNPMPLSEAEIRVIVKKAYEQNLHPIEVTKSELKVAAASVAKTRLVNIFKNEEELYEILGGFFNAMKDDAEVAEPLKAAGLKARFTYLEPNGAIAFDNSSNSVSILIGKEAAALEVDVEFTLKADLAHYFWHGQINPAKELATRKIIPKGNLPKAMKLLPILEPAYRLYPNYLRKIGKGNLAL